MIRSFKIRLLPNEQQQELLWKHANCSRFIWNFGLAYQENLFKNNQKHLSGYDLKKVVTQIKKQDKYSWLNDISAQTLNNTILDLDDAYKRFFKKQNRKPKFKKKNKCKIKFPVRTDCIYFNSLVVNIEKIGKVKYQTNYNLPQGRNVCKFTNPRIKYENNKWILSFGMEHNNQVQKLTNNSMGIDLGVKDLAVVSYNNEKLVFNNINKTNRLKSLKNKLKHLQRNVSRKYETNNINNIFENKWFKSKNIIKTQNQINKIYNKLSNIRKNYIHQITRELINKLPKRITMEDLNVIGMMKNKHLSKAIQEQCFYEFIRQMKYKSEFYGIEFILADRFYPSSKLCSDCGYIKKDLKLSDRIYKCEHCGLEIDRDKNASINLMNYKG